MSTDPIRLFDANSEAPEALRGLLQKARNVGPTAEQAARLAAKLGPAFGAAGAAAGGAAAGSSTLAISGGAKLVAALAVTGAIAGGALWFSSSKSADPKPA